MLIIIWGVNVRAEKWVRDAEPALLEVHYKRSEIYDTTKRSTQFNIDPVILRIGKTKSVFCGSKRLWRDSLIAVDPATFWQIDRARIMSDKKESAVEMVGHYWSYIYKNIPEDKVTEHCYFDMERWQYSEDWIKPEWKIGDNIKTILGYECIEATTTYKGREWTAWFAPEIPVQDGPWKLCGLPGLILEAYDSHREYIFEADGLVQNPNSEVGFFTYDDKRGVAKVSRDKFFNNWWKFKHSNFAAKMRAAFGVGPKLRPDENKPSVIHYDKEETDYPHDL